MSSVLGSPEPAAVFPELQKHLCDTAGATPKETRRASNSALSFNGDANGAADSLNALGGAKQDQDCGVLEFRGRQRHFADLHAVVTVVANALFACTSAANDDQARWAAVHGTMQDIDRELVQRYTATNPVPRIFSIPPRDAIVIFAFSLSLREGQAHRLQDALWAAMWEGSGAHGCGPMASFAAVLSRALKSALVPVRELFPGANEEGWLQCTVPNAPAPLGERVTGRTFLAMTPTASTAAAPSVPTAMETPTSYNVLVGVGMWGGRIRNLASVGPWCERRGNVEVVLLPGMVFRVKKVDKEVSPALFAMNLVGRAQRGPEPPVAAA
jgi:hypothetical protein